MGLFSFSSDPELFPGLKPQDPSWFAWYTLMKFYDRVKFTKPEARFFSKISGGLSQDLHDEVPRRWLILAGAGAGKSRFISRLILYRANIQFDPTIHPLQSGQKAENIIIAPSIKAGMINVEYIQAMLEENEVLYNELLPFHEGQEPIVKNRQEARMQFRNHSEISLAPVARISGRGRSIWTLVMEESAHFKVEGRFSDAEIYKSAAPRMGRFGMDAMCFLVTTPWDKSGLVWELFKKYYGRKNDSWLVLKGTTKEFNPTVEDRFLATQEEEDPVAFRREFLAEFSDSTYGAFSAEVIEELTVPGRRQLPYDSSFQYFGFIDSAGLSLSQTAKFNDEFASGIAHNNGSKVVIDWIGAWKAETDGKRVTPDDAVARSIDKFEQYHVRDVMGDRKDAGYIEPKLTNHQFAFTVCPLAKSDLYLQAIPMINDASVELLDEETTNKQLKTLEKRRGRQGRDFIQHVKDGHDDRANVVAGLIYMGRERMGTVNVSLKDVKIGSVPRPASEFGTADNDFSRIF